MGVKAKFTQPRIAVIFVFSLYIAICSAGLSLNIPFITLQKSPQHAPADHESPHHQSHHHDHHLDHHLHNILNHAHLDQKGTLYLHDPESTVKFYYKENLHGPSNRVDIHHDGCREVPMDYWYNKPKSLWAKHCITLYQSGHCKGEGVQVAGMVTELRSAGMHYGVNSFKPCEKNIRIRFLPSGDHKHHHHHHDDHHHHHHHH